VLGKKKKGRVVQSDKDKNENLMKMPFFATIVNKSLTFNCSIIDVDDAIFF